MRACFVAIIGAFTMAFIAGSPAVADVYEGFNYSGADFDGESGGTGFAGSWGLTGGGSAIVAGVESGSLNNDAYTLSSTGNKALSRNSAGSAERTLANAEKIDLNSDGGVVYFSYLLSSESPSDTENQLSFFDGSTVVLDTGIRNGSFRLRSGGSSQVTGGSPAADTTYFVVGFIDPNATGNDVFGSMSTLRLTRCPHQRPIAASPPIGRSTTTARA